MRDIIKQAAGDRLSAEAMQREVLMEVTRIDQLMSKYHGKAMTDAPDAIASGGLYHKLAERKHTLCGFNPITGYAVAIMNAATPTRKSTSTEEIRSVLEEFMRDGKALPAE